MSNYPPLILSLQELTAVLGPLTMGYKWGEDTIHDLWTMGAPVPNDNSRRIVFPNQVMKWLADVLTRQGRPLSDMAAIMADLVVK